MFEEAVASLLKNMDDFISEVSSALYFTIKERSSLISESYRSVCATNNGFLYMVNCSGVRLFFNLRYVLNRFLKKRRYFLCLLKVSLS